jgi:hypothetical protein
MDPQSKVDYSHITPEATMVVDKASGRDSPLRQGAKIELLDPPDLASTTAEACSMIRGKEIRRLGFFFVEGTL